MTTNMEQAINTNNQLLQKIETNFLTVEKLVSKITVLETRVKIQEMLALVKDRFVVAPYSSRTEYVGWYPGGLVDISLKVVGMMSKLHKLYETKTPSDSIILVGLFHDLGKIGSLEESYYTEQTSEWHQKQGMLFKVNKDLVHMNASQRTLWLLQHFKVYLKEDEYFAIATNVDKSHGEEVQKYSFNEPWISLLLQHSLRAIFLQEKTKTGILP